MEKQASRAAPMPTTVDRDRLLDCKQEIGLTATYLRSRSITRNA
jgi:hypothetical protein